MAKHLVPASSCLRNTFARGLHKLVWDRPGTTVHRNRSVPYVAPQCVPYGVAAEERRPLQEKLHFFVPSNSRLLLVEL